MGESKTDPLMDRRQLCDAFCPAIAQKVNQSKLSWKRAAREVLGRDDRAECQFMESKCCDVPCNMSNNPACQESYSYSRISPDTGLGLSTAQLRAAESELSQVAGAGSYTTGQT